MHLASNFKSDKSKSEVHYYDIHDAPQKVIFTGNDSLVDRVYGGADIKTLGAAGGWVGSAIDLTKIASSVDGLNHRNDILSCESLQYIGD